MQGERFHSRFAGYACRAIPNWKNQTLTSTHQPKAEKNQDHRSRSQINWKSKSSTYMHYICMYLPHLRPILAVQSYRIWYVRFRRFGIVAPYRQDTGRMCYRCRESRWPQSSRKEVEGENSPQSFKDNQSDRKSHMIPLWPVTDREKSWTGLASLEILESSSSLIIFPVFKHPMFRS